MADVKPIRSARHEEAIEERDRFLRRHPELRTLQDKIDFRLEGAQSSHNRLVLIQSLMMDSLRELDNELQSLVTARLARCSAGKGGSE